jgi:hypothetical protein
MFPTAILRRHHMLMLFMLSPGGNVEASAHDIVSLALNQPEPLQLDASCQQERRCGHGSGLGESLLVLDALETDGALDGGMDGALEMPWRRRCLGDGWCLGGAWCLMCTSTL